LTKAPGRAGLAKPRINDVENMLAEPSSLVFGQDGDIRHLKTVPPYALDCHFLMAAV